MTSGLWARGGMRRAGLLLKPLAEVLFWKPLYREIVCLLAKTMTAWRKVWVQSRSRLSDSRIYAAFFGGGVGNGFNKLNVISCNSCLNAQKFSLCLCVELKLETLELYYYYYYYYLSF